jgi:hypothetical protein
MTSSRLPLGRSSLAALVFTLAGVAGCHRDSESPAPHDAPVEAALP